MTDDINRTENVLMKVPSHWKIDEKSVNYKLLKSFAEELKVFDTNLSGLKAELFVDTATGSYLDDLGRMFKLGRYDEETDAEFRVRIKAYWPGFSGGGTLDSLKSTVNKITGVDTSKMTITEVDFMKFIFDVILDSPEDYPLADTIVELIWKVKAAGVYPFFQWTLTGNPFDDTVEVSDSITITNIDLPWFIIGESLIDGSSLIP